MEVNSKRASWSVVALVWMTTWQPGIILGGYLDHVSSVLHYPFLACVLVILTHRS